MIEKGYDIAIVALAVDLPKILMVRSIAKTTKGNENADQVSLKFKNSIGIDTRKFDMVITII